ncbi:MAG: hypothetical protein KY468_01855 [Armatimonadetes bacterium]|nr:hypothetical protein [Armatimonadota bacterium]
MHRSSVHPHSSRKSVPLAVGAGLLSILLFSVPGRAPAQTPAPGTIVTVAGNGTSPKVGESPGDGGPATAAGLHPPFDVTVDPSGRLFIPSPQGQRVRVVTPDGKIQTFAGGGTPPFPRMKGDPPFGIFFGNGGPATQVQMAPLKTAVDNEGNIYVTDVENQRIHRITPDGILTSIAGLGTDHSGYQFSSSPSVLRQDGRLATKTMISSSWGIALDSAGNLYFSDSGEGRVRKISPEGIVTTVAGKRMVPVGDGGPAVQARLINPSGLALDPAGNLFIADTSQHRIRRVGTDGIITTIAGTGVKGFGGDGGDAWQALLNEPHDVTVDAAGNLFIADSGNHRVRRLSPRSDGTYLISTVAGTGSVDEMGRGGFIGDGGPATEAQLFQPLGLGLDSAGNLYIADSANHRIRKLFGAAAPTPITAKPNRSSEEPTPSTITFDYANFITMDNLWLLADAAKAGERVRVTPAGMGKVGALYYGSKVMLQNGFETTFRFQLTDLRPLPGFRPGADGLALVIHNSNGGFLGDPGGALGYGNSISRCDCDGYSLGGITNAIAVEIDTWSNDVQYSDPNDNHISVHNTRVAADNVDERHSLGWSLAIPDLKDEKVHTVKVHYVPGTLSVFVDNLAHPALKVPLDLSKDLVLDNGRGWIGITAATGAGYENHDVLSWSFNNTLGAAPGTQTLGDVTNDGAVDIRDAVGTLQYIVGLKLQSQDQPSVMDVNVDGFVNVTDVMLMLRNTILH